jgi:hypothetical protein
VRRAAPAAVALLLAVLAGCGPRVGNVSGRVLLDGQPLPSGTVTFVAPDGREWPYRIGPDGEYQIADFPAGPARVKVTSQPRSPFGKTAPAEPRPAVLPDRYQDPQRSGLDLTVGPGHQDHNILLESPRR